MVVQKKMSVAGDSVDPPQLHMVVANLRWGLLVWPVVFQQNGLMQLRPDSALEWYFTTKNDQEESAFVSSPLLADCGVSVRLIAWENPVKTMLRSFSDTLTFNDLVLVAKTVFNMASPQKLSRVNLVKALAEEVGDAEFVQQVLANENKKTRKTTPEGDGENEDEEFDSDDELAELLLDQMDGAEADDFQDLKKRVNSRHVEAKKRKWSQWRAEDEEVSWQFNSNFATLWTCVIFALCKTYAP